MKAGKTTSPIRKRAVSLGGRKTSVSIEDEFWAGLKLIAGSRGLTAAQLIFEIDRARATSNLSSALRLFVLSFYRRTTAEPVSSEVQ